MDRRVAPFWMQTALAVAQTGSPLRAAAHLGISNATAYRHIDALEASLGFALFERRRAGWRPRARATALLAIGARMDALIAEADRRIRSDALAGAGPIRIAVSEDLATHYLVDKLYDYRRASDDVRPELIISSRFADLHHDEADVAIRPHAKPGPTLVGRRAGRMLHALYASRDYLRRSRIPPSAPLADHEYLGYGGALKAFAAAEWLDAAVPEDAVVARFNSTSALTHAVTAGLGVAVLPCFVGDSIGSLRPITTIDGGLAVEIWLVAAASNRNDPRVKAFFRYFAAAFRADSARFTGFPYG